MDERVVLLIVFCVGLLAITQGRQIVTKFDRTKWDRSTPTPDPNAHIVDIKTERVTYVKNKTHYKTTVIFSDNFLFMTHDTDRDDRFFTYTISLSPETTERIIKKATLAHDKEVAKLLNKTK